MNKHTKEKVSLEEAVEHCLEEGDVEGIYDIVKQAEHQAYQRVLDALPEKIDSTLPINKGLQQRYYTDGFNSAVVGITAIINSLMEDE